MANGTKAQIIRSFLTRRQGGQNGAVHKYFYDHYLFFGRDCPGRIPGQETRHLKLDAKSRITVVD